MPHPRNPHNGRYNFAELIDAHPALEEFVADNGHGEMSINFFDPKAVKALNQALIRSFYNIEFWDIPSNALTPPIPGRADYIHHLYDLIKPQNKTVILDVGVGANCIYPIIGAVQYGWSFVGSDVDKTSLKNAQQIIDQNISLHGKITLRKQSNRVNIFKGIINDEDYFEATICNPPFHDSAQSATRGTMRKLRNLKGRNNTKMELNFGGQDNELWCEGGELQFITNMIHESVIFRNQCRWFTTLVSKEDNLKSLKRVLKNIDVAQYRTIEMQQGNKRSRILAWRF
ncbi:MAG: 23S rRNA (adenine(1618)-N(6))-methyltransferase RlmF [Rikenellaceae bacterium]